MLNVQCDVNISLARELPPLTLRCMTHGAVRNDPVHDEVSVLVPQIDPSVPQPVFTITEKAPTTYGLLLVESGYYSFHI